MAIVNPSSPATAAATGQDGDLVARVRGHHRAFGKNQVLRGVDLDVHRGEFVALLGRSGCGKSTLLRSLAHLDPVPDGEVEVRGRSSVAFQEPRLLPWRDVRENVALALLNTDEKRQRHERAEQTLAEVSLTDKLHAWPLQLSGGQAQRVSLARALVSNPALLLLDEPLGALDALTRIEMHRLIEGLWQRHRFTALLVTHDVQEAVALADRVILIEDGRIALDENIGLARPRSQGDPAFAAIEKRILDRVLQKPDAELPDAAGEPRWQNAPGLRWAI